MGGQLNVMFLAAFVIYLSAVQVYGQLKPGGRNVCHRKVSYNAYENRRFTRIGYDNYRTCCKKKWGVCLSRCTRYRSKIVTYYNSVLVVRYRDSYFCCAGWAAAGSECTKAICSPACKNGDCVSPNKCSCKPGFQGKLCESDIDECAKSPCHQICNNIPGSYTCACRKGFVHSSTNPRDPTCQDVDECKTKPCKCAPGTPGCSATCQNVVGSFKCSCNSGFQLVGGLTCTDINECASKSTNGCAHKCLNTPGSYSCACNPGYVLAPDKRKCNDINECSNLNGGCTQRCINQVGTYYCACDTGFELKADKKTCVDIDECSRNKPCDQAHGICENTRGSYVCKCKTGYALQADKKTCKDINECSSPSLNSCAHNCHNNDGSYYCTCKVGFRLAADKRGCDDIDECAEKSHTCQHNCHNNVGSYTCSCRPGYKLEADGRKCKALPCQSITQPKNGQMKCSGFVTDESCAFNCDEGFNLFGSSVRKCLPTAIWSGEKTACEPKPCPKIQPPMHGSVLLPCVEEYNSTCLLKCGKGFYLHGDRSARCIVEKEKTRWDLHGSTCKAVEACVPNPCDHGGICTVLGIREYKCNCEGTGYTGTTCQVGLVQTPSYPQLNVNEKSDILYLRAKPDTEIKVALITENGEATFEPNEVIITKERGEGGFRLLAKKSGAFIIKYKVTGPSAPSYHQPKDDVVYAVVKRKISKPVSLKADFFATGCRTRSSGSCGSKALQLSSTCNWGTQTAGFVSVGDKSLKLPVSPVGMKTSTAEGIFRGGLVNPSQEVSDFLNKQSLSSCASWGKCNGYEFDIDAVNFVISNNLFSEGYYQSYMSLTPAWVRFALNRASNSFNPRDIFSTVGKGDSLKETGLCPSFQFKGGNIYSAFVPERQPILSLLGSTKSIKGKTGNCLLVDLCEKLAHFSVANEGVQLTSDFSSLGLDFINATSHGFGFGSFGKKCVKLGASPERCVNSNTYWKVTGSVTSGSSEIEYSGRVDVELADVEQALLQRLSTQQKLLFSGKLKVNTQMRVLGSTLGIKALDNDAQGYVQVGGSSSLCPLCNGNGIHLLLDAKKDVFQYDVSTLKFKPTSSHLRLSLLTDAYGGKVVGIENQNKISLSLRLFESLDKLFQALKVAMGSGYVEDAKIIFERSATLLKVIGEAMNVTSQAGADYMVVTKLIEQVKAANRDLLPTLKNLEQRLGSDPAAVKVKGAMRFLLLRLNQIDTLEALPKSESATVKSQGTVLAFEGEFCVHQLCFSSQDVTIYDVAGTVQSDTACKGCAHSDAGNIKADSVLISALTTRDTVLGKKVRLAKGSKIVLHASRKSNVVTGSFDGEINVFKRFYTATFTFTEKTLSVSARGVQVLLGLNFDIIGSNDVQKVSWDDVIQNVKGKSSTGSAAVSNLQRLAQEYFVQTGQTTQKRLKRSLERQQSATDAVNEQKKVINNAQILLKNATEDHRMARLAYQRQLVLLNRTQVELQSYMKDLGPIFIEKSLDRVCKFEDCKESCVSVPVCKVCQDPVKVGVDTLKCEPASEVIRTNVLETFKTKCELRKYLFIPVYTGSCAEDPGAAAARDRQLQQNLASTGAATGALIGSVIPGIGTVLGGVIGGVVGFIGGLFSSCDKSYEVYTKTWTVQVDCTKTRDVVKTVKRTFSECFYVKQKVQTGYDQPQQCNCTTNPCLTKRKDPACLIENTKCQELRGEFLKTSDKIPKKFTDTYNKAEQLKNNVKAAFVSVRKTEKEKNFYEDEYNRAVIFGKHKAEDAKIATQSQSNVASLLVTESCLSKRYEQSSNLSSHLLVDYLSFDTSLPLIDNVQIDAHVKNLAKKATGAVPFVLQLEDQELSLVAGAKKIVRRELCNAARRRRSVEQADHDDVAFTSWYIDRGQNASVVQKACLTFESTTGYVNHIFENLLDLSKDAIALRRKVDESKRSLGSASAFSASSGETNVIVSAQKEELQSIGNSLDIQETRTRAEEVQSLWKANSEVYTGLNNVSVCLNVEDCLQVTFDSLKKLPTMFRVPRKTYLAYVTRAERHAYIALKNTTSLVELINTAMVVKETIAVMQRQSLLCSDAPKASINCEEKYIVKEGERVSFSVKVQSLLPVQYVWKRGKQVLEDETSSYLRFKASPGKGGFYTCTVVSLAGSTTTNGTLVVVEHAPKFTAEPKDTVYYNPSPKDYLAAFTCNVTAEPEAKIEWYYLPLTGPQLQKKIPEEPGSILAFAAPLKSNAGYYFCRAQNKHGMIQSRKARLDVVDIALAKQKIVFSFKVSGPLQNLTNGSFVNIEKKMQVDHQLTVTSKFERDGKDGMLTFDIRVTPNDTAMNSSELLLASAAKARQALANSLSTLMVEILTSQSSILTADGFRLSVDNGTMQSEFFGNICKPGYSPKSDGFLCAECPAGTYEKESKCVPCKIGRYQSLTGQTKCSACDEGEVTESTGATNPLSCVNPRESKLDMVFLLDTSKSVRYYDWKKMKSLVLRYTDYFAVNDSVRVGIISYGNRVFIDVDLGDYENKEALIAEIGLIDRQRGWTRTYDAMAEALEMFRVKGREDSKKVVLIFSDGRATSSRGIPGFSLIREESFNLRADGIHVISVGVGRRPDRFELLAAASYPKENNTFMMEDSYALLPNATADIVKNLYSGNCFKATGVDIGLLADPIDRYDDLVKAEGFLKTMLAEAYRSLNTTVKVSMFNVFSPWGHPGYFQEYKNLYRLERHIELYLTRPFSFFDTRQALKEVVNARFDEWSGSFSRVKVLVLLTPEEADQRTLDFKRKYPDEEIKIVNVVTRTLPAGKEGTGKSVFHTSQAEEVLEFLSSALAKTYCEP